MNFPLIINNRLSQNILKLFGTFIKLLYFFKNYLHKFLTDVSYKIMGGLLSNSGGEKDDPTPS
jgi:hypothetical protein